MHLNDENISEYLLSTYGIKSSLYKIYIKDIEPLLQNDYGQENDCTLTSITTIIKYYNKTIQVDVIYSITESIAKKYFYNGSKGTLPLFISTIYNKVLESFYIKKKTKCKLIQDQINKQQPILLNMFDDGKNFYHNHTVSIIGYAIYDDVRLLMIYDNWFKEISYIDYNKLSSISSINYLI